MAESKTNQKVRLNLELTTQVRDQLENLQQSSQATSLTEVIRKSLALYHMVTDHTAQGGGIILEHADGSKERLKLL
jgi:hypothetical protein